VQINKF